MTMDFAYYSRVLPLTYADVLLRLSAAVGVGLAIGLDRELRRKPAGLRTMALVSLGSAVYVLAALDSGGGVSFDAGSRSIQGVVTGVGFLGAGAILRGDTDGSVRGLTTAASIWLAAASGVACGLGQWPLVVASASLGLLVLILSPVERILHNRRRTDTPVSTSLP
jgi:putative Mg2+ transporter-C (MgtC) family protein